MLEQIGVETARRIAQAHHPSRIAAAVALYWQRLDAGDELTPGWVVWRIKEPGLVEAAGRYMDEVARYL